jgi:FtsX-like permease family protein
MISPREWGNDLTVGVRLAVGGGRTAIVRLVLSALGIAIATTVLLVATCVGTMSENRTQRAMSDFTQADPIAGVSPTYLTRRYSEFHGESVRITYAWGSGPDSPKPDTLPALPKPGEMYVSPALADLLRSDESRLLRPRLPEKVVGILDESLVIEPSYLTAWVGADSTLADSIFVEEAYGFHADLQLNAPDEGMLALILIGAVLLLLPVFTFVTSASRVAGAERDRRLSALRLVGAGKWQVRRIASAESLVSAVLGMAVGGAIFSVGRLFAQDINLFGESVYNSDVVPDPMLAFLVLALVPVLSVLTALFALRRTIIEPLGVFRQTKPIRRRAWWRFALVALGVLLLTTQLGEAEGTDNWAFMIAAGTALLLVGMVVLLPWLVERVANRITGGPPSWALAIRRLQLDSGTSSRVVGGVAVVLAGMITMQTVLLSMGGALAMPSNDANRQGMVNVSADASLVADIRRRLAHTPGVESASAVVSGAAYETGSKDISYGFNVADCATLRELGGVKTCHDGDVFQRASTYEKPPLPGTALEFREFAGVGSDWDPDEYTVTGTWTVPDHLRTLTVDDSSPLYGTLYATPGALPDPMAVPDIGSVLAKVDKDITSDQLEGVRNVLAGFRWHADSYSYNTAPELSADQQAFASIRTALYAGSVFTLLLAGVSMLVMALEHIRERRRALAVLAASGVPRSVLGRSLLWQVALPIGLGVLMALVTGIGLAAMMMRVSKEPMTVDWLGVALMCVGAVVLTLLVNALTLPFLKRAMRLNTLRTE